MEIIAWQKQVKSLLLEMSKANHCLGDIVRDFDLPVSERDREKTTVLQVKLYFQCTTVRDNASSVWLKPLLEYLPWPEAGNWFHSFHLVYERVPTLDLYNSAEVVKLYNEFVQSMSDMNCIASRIGAKLTPQNPTELETSGTTDRFLTGTNVLDSQDHAKSLPSWVGEHFKSNQYKLIKALWGNDEMPKCDLIETLYPNESGKEEAIDKVKQRANAKLAENNLGYEISERRAEMYILVRL